MNWIYSKPLACFLDLVHDFGPPDYVVERPGGLAVWKEGLGNLKSTCFSEIILKDEEILHPIPTNEHYDFLYTSVKLKIPEDKICNVISLSESVMYDKLKMELWVRCHHIVPNVVTLYLASSIGKGMMSLSDAKNQYTPLIKRAVQNKDLARELYLKLCGLLHLS